MQLKNAGLIESTRGTGGTKITKPLSEITFFRYIQSGGMRWGKLTFSFSWTFKWKVPGRQKYPQRLRRQIEVCTAGYGKEIAGNHTRWCGKWFEKVLAGI